MMPRLFKAMLLGFAVGVSGLLISPFQSVRSLEENMGLGLLFKLRGEKHASLDVVVVSIDKESSEKLDIPDNPDKWPRSLHARLTEKLKKEGAGVVSFDVHFIEPRVAEDDNLFATSIKNVRNVVLCEPMTAKEIPLSGKDRSSPGVHNIVKIVKPIPLFSKAALATAPFPLPRIPFKVNNYWAFQTGAGDSPTLPTVAFQLFSMPIYDEFVQLMEQANPGLAGKLPAEKDTALATLGVKGLIRNTRQIFVNEPMLAEKMLAELERSKTEPSDVKRHRLLKSLIKLYGGPNRRYINFYGPPRTVTTIPYYQALQLGEGTVEGRHTNLKGKAVFVGLSEVLLADRKDSFYTVFSQANGIFVSGVEIAATAWSNIIDDAPVKPAGSSIYFTIILVWGILMGTVCRLYPLKIAASGAVGVSVCYLAGTVFLFKFSDSWFPVIIPLMFQTPLAFAGAVGIKYAGLFKQYLVKLRMEDDLSVARDLQASMLPADCPKIEGYKIAASSTPAREVGGDFFDFIEIGKNRLGFVVADVTGKSVSGALVMSLSRSVFRMVSENELSIGEIMVRANRQIKKDIKSGMFVALLYAVLDTQDRTLEMCSAGQTQPILMSAESGEAVLVETIGDTFPLGILDSADYQGTRVQLSPGDKIVFYTDGIVEAMNKKEEMYGFERLLDVVQASRYMDADSLLTEIISRVNTFASGIEQHDDITVIVLGVTPTQL
jgi:serine phosphatase RsbU (regulator of sigma subunit)/CHASE2 domain-containing sensor protein